MIQAGTINGSGNLLAEGGGTIDTYYGDGGGGAGGRIALYYGSSTLTLEQISAQGAKTDGTHESSQKGGAGTIYLKASAATNGDIVIDNEDITWSTSRSRVARTPLPATLTTDNLTIVNYANVDYSSALTVVSTLTVDQKAFLGISSSVSTNSLVIHNNAYLHNDTGANVSYSSLDWNGGGFVDNGGTLQLLSGGGDLTIPATSTLFANVPRNYSNVIISGTLTHTDNTDSETYKIDYNISGNLTISSTGLVNANSKGYSDGNGLGDGTDGDGGAGGAAHGGNGGNGQTRAGSTFSYGSATQPNTIGSGGGQRSYAAGHGGGAVKFIVGGRADIGGPISVNGGNGGSVDHHGSGGGSGGSVWIDANEIVGNSTISANGGNGSGDTYYGDSGAGGGGRIALYYGTSTFTLNQLSVQGGTPYGNHGNIQRGGAGTIYLKADSATNGDLVIDNEDTVWSIDRTRVAKTSLSTLLTVDNLTVTNYANVDYSSTLTIAVITVGYTPFDTILINC